MTSFGSSTHMFGGSSLPSGKVHRFLENVTEPSAVVGAINVYSKDGALFAQLPDGKKINITESPNATLVENYTAENLIKQDSDGKLVDTGININDLTREGNTFNGADNLVKLDANGKMPALDGSQMTRLTKSQVGLGNVDNTSDSNKPVSTDTQLALDAKANKVTSFTAGNVLKVDENGHPQDSGETIATLKDGWQGTVATFADLPSASSSNNGHVYKVTTETGVIGINKKYSGSYISNGTSWSIFGYKQESVINQPLSGFTLPSTASQVTSSDSILVAIEKVQKQIDNSLGTVSLDDVTETPTKKILNTGSQVIDGTKQFTSNIQIPTNPTQNYHAASKAYVDSNIATQPTGSFLFLANEVLPTGYLWCNGSFYDRYVYASLFAILGYAYGQSGTDFATPPIMNENRYFAGATGGTVGTMVGSQNKAHVHDLVYKESYYAGGASVLKQGSTQGSFNRKRTTTSEGGTDVRTKTYYSAVAIKY